MCNPHPKTNGVIPGMVLSTGNKGQPLPFGHPVATPKMPLNETKPTLKRLSFTLAYPL